MARDLIHITQTLAFDPFADPNPFPHIGDFYTFAHFVAICMEKQTFRCGKFKYPHIEILTDSEKKKT